MNKEAAVFLGAGRAALLQLAHPFVAYAIDRHSKTRDDPLGRFRRTFYQVFSMVFGAQERAFWVHATLWDTSVTCYEALVRPLSLEEKHEYYEETKRFAYLFETL